MNESQRTRYLARFLDELCLGIGPRPAGTHADEACAAAVSRELDAFCDDCETQVFPFERWECKSPAVLRIGGREVECFPFYGSPPTPRGGLAGTIAPVGAGGGAIGRAHPQGSDGASASGTETGPVVPGARGYELRAEPRSASAGGGPLARFVPGPFGPAVPRFNRELLVERIPVAGIGEDALRLVASGATHGELEFDALTEEPARSRNVIGHIEGASAHEVVIVAHLDTQYNTPGANDNAASLATMLLLAEHYRQHRPRHTLTFLASGAEEIGCLGAREYVRRRAEEGSLGRVDLCINFDSLTYGPDPQIYTRRTDLARSVAGSYAAQGRSAGITVIPRLFEEDDTLDGAPFIERGIPVIYLNSRGDDDRTLRLWHRPEDLPQRVERSLVELSLGALVRFLDELEVR